MSNRSRVFSAKPNCQRQPFDCDSVKTKLTYALTSNFEGLFNTNCQTQIPISKRFYI